MEMACGAHCQDYVGRADTLPGLSDPEALCPAVKLAMPFFLFLSLFVTWAGVFLFDFNFFFIWGELDAIVIFEQKMGYYYLEDSPVRIRNDGSASRSATEKPAGFSARGLV